jgi:hypothetical protein
MPICRRFRPGAVHQQVEILRPGQNEKHYLGATKYSDRRNRLDGKGGRNTASYSFRCYPAAKRIHVIEDDYTIQTTNQVEVSYRATRDAASAHTVLLGPHKHRANVERPTCQCDPHSPANRNERNTEARRAVVPAPPHPSTTNYNRPMTLILPTITLSDVTGHHPSHCG